jgi:DNA repair exonuclease SbcCD ATPase subunit
MSWEDEAATIRDRVDELAMKQATADDWRLADLQLVHALAEAQQQIATLQGEMVKLIKSSKPNWCWFRTHAEIREIREVMDDLRVLRMCVRTRIFELEAGDAQVLSPSS